MAEVKGKIRICQSSIGDFNVDQINGSAFYKRYVEFMRVFQKHIHEYSPDIIFAQPEENAVKGTIDWYIPTPDSVPTTLDSLKEIDPQEYQFYGDLRNKVVKYLKNIEQQIISPQERQYFACALKYLDSEYAEKITYCYNDKISFAVWGMGLRKGRTLETVITDDVKEHRIHTITYVVDGNGSINGKSSILRKHGHVLQGIKDVPEIVPAKHFSFIEWKPCAPQGKTVDKNIIYTAVCVRTDDYQIDFVASEGGIVDGITSVMKKPGDLLVETDVPSVSADNGYRFVGWSPQLKLNETVADDELYTAHFEEVPPIPPVPPTPTMYKVVFTSGDNGVLVGQESLFVHPGSLLLNDQIPSVKANKGYTFDGWDKQTDAPINSDITFTAIYSKKKLPWYRRFWLWLSSLFAGKGCLKWLLWILLLLLGLWLLSFFMKSCVGCSGWGSVNGVVPIDSTKGGKDNNGVVRPITGDGGKLPKDSRIVAPVIGGGGEEPPIIRQPGAPNIIANRLFLFMEDEDGNIEDLAREFKKVYQDDKYSIIGYDREVKLLVVQIPEAERNEIRETINSKIPNLKFLVFDEQVYELRGTVSTASSAPGWHLKAVHLQEGWKITKGDNTVRVAVVDDGIQADHPMFAGRIVDAYNVFTQNNHLSVGQGHGTHTAGLAVGCSDFYQKGASGIAPNCQLIPIQVFDNGQCPLSALVAGVMYAVHHDADVVNLSVGPSFKGLNQLPVEMQDQIARQQFKNVEILWNRVCTIAAQKNCILVFAAGNDDILSSIPPENRNMSSIVVTAVNEKYYPTDFTNYGPCSDISSPGKGIYSSFPTSSFQFCDGTSMAAPIVTGTIALMKSIHKGLTVEQARNVLQRTGADVYGYIPPMVLVDKALAATKRGDFSPPKERPVRPVPEGLGDDSSAGKVPERNISNPGTPPPNTAKPSVPGNETDYDAIRKLIKEYEEKIRKLKEQLPENK